MHHEDDHFDLEESIRKSITGLIGSQFVAMIVGCCLSVMAMDSFWAALIVMILILFYYNIAILGTNRRSHSAIIIYLITSIGLLVAIIAIIILVFIITLSTSDPSQYGIRDNINTPLFLTTFGIMSALWSFTIVYSLIFACVLLNLIYRQEEIENQKTINALEDCQTYFQPLQYPPPYHVYNPQPTYRSYRPYDSSTADHVESRLTYA